MGGLVWSNVMCHPVEKDGKKRKKKKRRRKKRKKRRRKKGDSQDGVMGYMISV